MPRNTPKPPSNIRVGQRFVLGSQKLGKGSFGSIYLGTDTENDDVSQKELKKSKSPQLIYEGNLIKKLQGNVGIPKLFYYGAEGNYNVMVMERLGPTLEDLFNECNRSFSLKTVLMIGYQIITRLQNIHEQGIIHRDIKPDNFLMGLGEHQNTIYIIDFGLGKYYRDNSNGNHIKYRENKALTGTARYASMYTHLGIEQSRRDDLESLGYILLYFLLGSLPWQGIEGNTRIEKYENIGDKKMEITVEDLCIGAPNAFKIYINYVKNLRFTQQPDYDYLRKLFSDLLESESLPNDNIFDWNE